MTECEIRELLHLSDNVKLQRQHDCWLVGAPQRSPMFVNIRRKTEASWHRKGKRYEYGIPLKQAQRYQQYPNLILIIHEVKSNEVLAAKFANLVSTARIYEKDTIDKGGTMFVRKCEMKPLVRR